MPPGAITGYIDVAQMVLYAFWVFFFLLIWYLRKEDKREGYPLVSDRADGARLEGFPRMPRPKIFILPHGGIQTAPRLEAPWALRDAAPGVLPGAPLQTAATPLLDSIGPGAYAETRADVPDLSLEDALPRIVPLRAAPGYFLAAEDPDPRGMAVIGADRRGAGVVVDAWVDRSEVVIRYLEIELASERGLRRVLLPMPFAKVDARRRCIRVRSILAGQFAGVPELLNPDEITLLEEDRISAYYGGGTLYATPSRLGPVL